PSVWGGHTNADHTSGLYGESMGLYVSMTGADAYDELPEMDNLILDGWSYSAIGANRGPALVHHVYLKNCRREGYGYGIWPGRDPVPDDDIEYRQVFAVVRTKDVRHSIDGISSGFDAEGSSSYEGDINVESFYLTGNNRSARVNQHGNADGDGTPDVGYG